MNENDDVKKINILFATGECLPFCASGGVADMCYALPKYLNRVQEVDVRVVLPCYSSIPEEYKSKFRLVGEVEKHHEERYRKLLENVETNKVFTKDTGIHPILLSKPFVRIYQRDNMPRRTPRYHRLKFP